MDTPVLEVLNDGVKEQQTYKEGLVSVMVVKPLFFSLYQYISVSCLFVTGRDLILILLIYIFEQSGAYSEIMFGWGANP